MLDERRTSFFRRGAVCCVLLQCCGARTSGSVGSWTTTALAPRLPTVYRSVYGLWSTSSLPTAHPRIHGPSTALSRGKMSGPVSHFLPTRLRQCFRAPRKSGAGGPDATGHSCAGHMCGIFGIFGMQSVSGHRGSVFGRTQSEPYPLGA